MNKILIFLLGEFSKLDKVLFDLSVENQNRYLSSLLIPNDDIDRSYLQYRCQSFFSPCWKTVLLNIVAAFLIPFSVFYLWLKSFFYTSCSSNLEALGDFKRFEEIVPDELNSEFRISNDVWLLGSCLSFADICFLLHVFLRYPLYCYFLLKVTIKVAGYSFMITKYQSKAIVVHNEYSFTSSILTAYCETRNVLHINVMHGEKMYYIRDSYFRYDRCYVWDAYYRDLFISMNAAPSQFIIALPPSMKINCAKHVNEGCYAYYKYFLTSQTKEQLVSISNSLQSLLMHGRKVKYRLHPRYSDRELVKQIVGKENVEYPEKVSILDSISNMDTAIGLYTTVLNQAYHCGKNVIIDDVTYPSEVKKLEEFKYIMIHKKLPLLSELIKK